MTRPPFDRMNRIIKRIRDGDYPNRGKLAEELDVTPKTIQRDIDFMRDRWNVPVSYDPTKYGYFFTESFENFPLLPMSEGELVAIFVAQKALIPYHGTAFEQPLRAAFEKLSENLTGLVSVAWSDLDAAISFRSIEANPADAKIFQGISTSVQQRREIEFDYRKLNDTTFQKRRVRPYHLACVNNQWYPFAFDLMRKAVRRFVLPRMRAFRTLNATFMKPKDFSIDEFLKGSFGVFSASGEYSVRIRFDSFSAQLIRERTWHHSQIVQELPKGEIELSLKLSSLTEIEPWILGWGVHAQVLAPSELRKSVGKTARLVAKAHQ